MYRPQVKITIQKGTELNVFYIYHVNSIEIDHNINNLTDTCQIKLPKKDSNLENNDLFYEYALNHFIEIGDKIKVELGYNEYKTVFEGYIKRFDLVNDGVILVCDDSMYLLKKANRSLHSWNDNPTLRSVIEEITNGLVTLDNILTFSFDKLRVKDLLSPAEIIQMISEQYNFFSYFRDNSLNVGFKYPTNIDSKNYEFAYPHEIDRNPIIVNNLQRQYINEEQLVIIGKSVQPSNEVITAYVDIDNLDGIISNDIPEKDTKIELNIPGLSNDSILEMLKNKWESLSKTGYKGTFTTFGKPYLRVADKVDLNLQYSTNTENGLYYIDSVYTTLDSNGYRQEVTLGSKI